MSNYSNNSCNDYDAIPVKVNKVFDSCSDKECITGVQVTLETALSEDVTIVKPRCITVADACITVDPIPFNKGFYSVDITFTFNIELATYVTACGTPTLITGTAVASKSCILYGGETNSRTFSSDGSVIGTNGECCNIVNPPTALVQAVSPLVLESRIATICTGCECGNTETCTSERGILLTIGLFYVVELVRPVTVMVPTLAYTIPKKECCNETGNPCEIFNRIKFPVEDFNPVNDTNTSYNFGCGCGCNNNVSTLSISSPTVQSDNYNCNCGCDD